MNESVTDQDILSILEKLPTTFKTIRLLRGLSLRECAIELNISFSTLARFENNKPVISTTIQKILAWLPERTQP